MGSGQSALGEQVGFPACAKWISDTSLRFGHRAIEELGPNPEITRFKGLGEISPDEFKHFIGKDMRLEQVSLRKTDLVKELLEFYMGKNTMERQNFIINNLVIEEDLAS